MLSGPVDLLFLAVFMASVVCCVVISCVVVGKLEMCLLILRYVTSVLCFVMFVNCLLKLLAFCLFVVAILLLKVMVWLVVGVGFLLDRLFIVLQSLSVFCLWSQLSSRCDFQMSVLYVSISVFICLLREWILESVGFCVLI